MDPLVTAHIAAKKRLQNLAAQAAGTAWDQLPHYDRANVDQFLSAALPVLAGANLQSVALTDAFLALKLHRAPLGLDAAAIVAGIRNGATPEEVYTRSFVTVWSALGKGTPFDQAVRMGRERAQSAAATDVQLAFRDTLQAAGEADSTIMGYERVADAGACEFCLEVNGAQFLTPDPMPLHNHCGCGVEPVEYTRGRGPGSLLHGRTTSPFEPTPTPDTVAIHDHGELGPILSAPGDRFAGPAALAA